MRLIFIGDVVGDEGENAGLTLLERELPELRRRLRPDLVIANGENASLTGATPVGGCGLSLAAADRLRAAGVDVITGGNHSWDGAEADRVLAAPDVLRPANMGRHAPGRGALLVPTPAGTVGVVNLASLTAIPQVDHHLDTLEAVLAEWGSQADAVLVDFHGESVSEKQIFAFSVAGRVSAVMGTHTHAATLDAQILPGGTAFVSDVGMTGPTGGMQGYDPAVFMDAIRTRLPRYARGALASGPAVLGAVTIQLEQGRATAIERLHARKGVPA